MAEEKGFRMHPSIILSFSIVLAALIVAGSILFATTSITNSISGLELTVPSGTGSGEAAPVAAPGAGQPRPEPTDNAPAEPPANQQIDGLLVNPSFTEGDPNAPVVVVEFSDFECPFCKRAFGGPVAQIKETYINTGKVFFVYQDFPLAFHQYAQDAAEAVRCAGKQGNESALKLHNELFALQELNNDTIVQAAQDAGLDMGAFNACVASGETTTLVNASFALGQQAGVQGTPTFFIGPNGGTAEKIVGAQLFSVFDTAIKKYLN